MTEVVEWLEAKKIVETFTYSGKTRFAFLYTWTSTGPENSIPPQK